MKYCKNINMFYKSEKLCITHDKKKYNKVIHYEFNY